MNVELRAPTATDPLGWLDTALAELDAADLRRHLRHLGSPAGPRVHLPGRGELVHLCSNSYLGLATHPEVVAAAREAAGRWGTGPGASRLITGGQQLQRDLEQDLAAWKGKADAVLFSSGYLANLGVISALAGPGDTVVSDELNHASIIDGCRLSRAEVRVYRHADPEHADRLLRDAPGRRLLITDGVFSMDGDVAPLAELCDRAERHGAAVVVDDAHGSGLLGPDGAGTSAAAGCTERVDAIVGTLSKALGSTGGYVATSTAAAEWLRNRARPFVFDTAPAAPTVAAAHAALRVARAEPERRQRALSLARRLGDRLVALGAEAGTPHACVIPVVVGDNPRALQVMGTLLDQGVLAVAIRPPSVPEGTARIRATVMATHTDEDLERATAAFAAALGR